MSVSLEAASIVFAAGRGSRMKGYDGNKTLLPLVPGGDMFNGETPLIENIIANLPPGPKAVVVNYCSQAVRQALARHTVVFCHQPVLNGTGGALLSAQEFVHQTRVPHVLITMGDVPLVDRQTYETMVAKLDRHSMVILGFKTHDKKQYGLIETHADAVQRIVEWKLWKNYSADLQSRLTTCNAGIYAVRREALRQYLPRLYDMPQVVRKVIDGRETEFEEYFITDMIEMMCRDGLRVGVQLAADSMETVGVDDPQALAQVQTVYARRLNKGPCDAPSKNM